MRKYWLHVALVLGVCAVAGVASAEPEVAFVGATLIDGTGAAPVPDSVVVVRGARVVAAGPRASTLVPEGARRVDAAGRWLIPGLIDMHVHMDEVLDPAEFVRYGVTSVRDVGSRLVTIQRIRAGQAKGKTAPRIFWMGRNIDEGKPSWWGAVAVKSPHEVPALLADMARQGVDGVKLYVNAGPAVAAAVVREAHRRGWPVTAHLQKTTPFAAARAGIDNLEHVSQLFVGLKREPKAAVQGYIRGFTGVAEVNLDGKPAQALVSELARRKVAITPTLAVSTLPVLGERGVAPIYAGWAPVSPAWRRYWNSAYWSFISTKGWSPADYATARRAQESYRILVHRAWQAGAPIIAGTDTPAPWVLPGAGLVHELEMLRACGLPPLEVLRAATGRAGAVLRHPDEVGVVKAGSRADLLLLDGDPLADIRNLRRVRAVYQGGKRVAPRA